MNSQLIIIFDKEKDLKNIWDACNAKPSYGHNWKGSISKNISKICKGKKYEKCKDELEKKMISLYNNPLIKLTAKSFDSGWSNISDKYFRRLEKITKRKISLKKVEAYLTTAARCPYSPNKKIPYFYINFFSSIPNALHTMGHELMHIHLHNTNWWEYVENKIGNDKTHDLKEALTQLLNLEFRDLWLVQEKGYPNHKLLRNYISKKWKERKDFNKLTDDCINWIKRNGVK